MLSVKALFTLLAATAAVAMPTDAIEKRTVGGIYLCHGTNWQDCSYKVQPLRTCIGLDSPWYHNVRSMGPDQGTTCILHSDKNCKSDAWDQKSTIQYPGTGDMNKVNGFDTNWNDNLGSFWCDRTFGWTGN